MTGSLDLAHVFSPIEVGTLSLDHRVVVPPNGAGGGNLLGSDADFEQHCAFWEARARGGVQWLGGGPNFVRNPMPLGFEPTGVGAHGPGIFRHPRYPVRLAEFARRMHDIGAYISVQMVQQGGMPNGPSPTFSGYADHRIAHALTLDEVRWLVRECGESAAIALEAGADAIEIHANHDDIVQWFLSPATNHRDDEYGGSPENRWRLLREILGTIRELAPGPFTLGARLNLDEFIDGGYHLDDTCRLVETLTADGTLDYVSLDVGGNWDAPSYIPIAWHEDAEWAELCGVVKAHTRLPVVYAGRVRSVEQAEAVLAAGQADLIAMARAHMADPMVVDTARRRLAGEEVAPVRPCIGLNDCIHRMVVDGLPSACGVNPSYGREARLADRPTRTASPCSVLVVGAGPAGSELAAQCAEQGHTVQLWERNQAIGGALAMAALARGNRTYGDWIDHQAARLVRAGVDLRLGVEATLDDLLASEADVIAVATGATPRIPDIPGVDQPHVVTLAAALGGAVPEGARVVMICEDDGPAPLTVCDHLAGSGHAVTLVHQSTAPAPLVGKYSIGSMLARVIDSGVEFVPMARAVAIDGATVHLASAYGSRRWSLEGADAVVLATGSVPDDSLYRRLSARRDGVHLLGDAFAPRRMVFATRQAFALAQSLLHGPGSS